MTAPLTTTWSSVRGCLDPVLMRGSLLHYSKQFTPTCRAPLSIYTTCQVRHAGHSLLAPISKLGASRDLADDIKAGRHRNNKEIVAAFEKIQTFEEIHYRKADAPWELIPRYVKKRVSDMIGLLQSEHKMEMEQIIEKMLPIANVDMYVVIVPTVGFVTTQAFAHSIMFDWQIGEPQGNGLLLVICQQEATVHLCASPAIQRYFGDHFLRLAIEEIFQPLVREGKPSYAVLMLTYAIATHAHEARDHFSNSLIPMPMRNKILRTKDITLYGMFHQFSYFGGSIICALITVIIWAQVMDMICPECGAFMCKVTDKERMSNMMSRGQSIEFKNECAHFRAWKCGKCHKGERVVVMSRDLHQSQKCLKCMDCNFYTASLEKSVEKLPTKYEDGIKRLVYTCEHCRIGREINLPLYRPIDTKPDEQWYGFLLERSQTPAASANKINLKL
eukprot:Tbor_TRINITY_DN3360_c0_g1::TRINITY_DN3360_c0_g1_i1::g.23488::m.23488